MPPRFPTLALGAATLAALPPSLAAVPATPRPSAAPAVAGPVNPLVHPVPVAIQAVAGQTVRLRVLTAGGTPIGETGPVVVAGPSTTVWTGHRGAGLAGPPAPTGRYRFEVVDATGAIVPSSPADVMVDRTPPVVRPLAPPTPSIPQPAVTAVRARITTPIFASFGPVPVRARTVVTTENGRVLGAGAWTPSGRPFPLPPRLLRSRRAGLVRVPIRARDAAGNVATSPPIQVSLEGPTGPARTTRRVATRWPVVALSFDDGYDAPALASILATALRTRTPVTLCLNGRNAVRWPAALRARLRGAVAAGLAQPCNHGYSHRTGTGTPESAAEADLRANAVVDRIFGVSSIPFYRPPYGAVGPGILSAARVLGYRDVLLWSVDTDDWRGLAPATITAEVLGEARPGAIVLMHALPQSAAAFPRIVAGLRAKGLRPVLIGDLLASGRPSAR